MSHEWLATSDKWGILPILAQILDELIKEVFDLTRGMLFKYHTIYRKINNHKKCAGIGLDGFIFKKIDKKYCINEKKESLEGRLGCSC